MDLCASPYFFKTALDFREFINVELKWHELDHPEHFQVADGIRPLFKRFSLLNSSNSSIRACSMRRTVTKRIYWSYLPRNLCKTNTIERKSHLLNVVGRERSSWKGGSSQRNWQKWRSSQRKKLRKNQQRFIFRHKGSETQIFFIIERIEQLMSSARLVF